MLIGVCLALLMGSIGALALECAVTAGGLLLCALLLARFFI